MCQVDDGFTEDEVAGDLMYPARNSLLDGLRNKVFWFFVEGFPDANNVGDIFRWVADFTGTMGVHAFAMSAK